MARRLSSPILIGREDEWRALDVALQEAQDGRPSVVLVGGEAGVGKTRLVAEFAARVRAVGGTATIGAAPPPMGASRTPFAALTPALRGLLRAFDARRLDRVLGSARADLAGLLPELGSPPLLTGAPESMAGPRFAEAVMLTVQEAASSRPPVLVALEDVHWADDETRAVMTYLCRNLVDASVVIVITFRDDSLHADPALLALIAELSRLPGAERVSLAPLEPEEIVQQVRAIMGTDPETAIVHALVRRSNGNPFFVEELLASVLEGGPERPPPSVRTMVDARLALVSGTSRMLVEVAAIAGSDVPAALLMSLSGLGSSAFDLALREAIDASLVLPSESPAGWQEGTGPDADRVGIRHVLVREVIVAELSGPRRRELHASLAAAIEAAPALGGDSELERASRLAAHLLLAGETARAVPALLEEAAAAERARAFGAAHDAYRRALAAWRPMLDGPSLARLDLPGTLDRAAQAASLAGDARAAVDLGNDALATLGREARAWQDDDPERSTRFRLHLGLALAQEGATEAALAELTLAAAAAPPGSLLRARCQTALARRSIAAMRHEEGARLALEAAALAERLGGRAEAAEARAVQAVALGAMGRISEARAALGRVPPSSDSRDPMTGSTSRPSRLAEAALAYLDRSAVLEQAGDPSSAAREALRGRDEAARRGLAGSVGRLLAATAARDLLRTGAWDEAARLLASDETGTTTRLDRRRGPGATETALVRARLAGLRGAWAESGTELEAARSPNAVLTQPGWAAYADIVDAEVACWRRRHAEARVSVGRGIAAADAEGDRVALFDLALLGLRLEADAAGSSGRADARAAATAEEQAAGLMVRLRAALEPSPAEEPAGQTERAAHGVAGDARPARETATLATGVAELARVTRSEPTVGAWETAAAAWAHAGDPYAQAYCRWRLADATIAEAGDRPAAAAMLRSALVVAEGLEARPMAAEIEQLARRARLVGVREHQRPVGTASSPGRTEARRRGLSEREIEVLSLLAEGLSDREVAARLFITTKTAGHHVSHILTKLGLERRGEAAAVAFRIGLASPEA